MRRAAFSFPARAAKFSLLLVTATGVSASALTPHDASSGFINEVRAAFNGLSRSAYAVFVIGSTVIDYKYSLHGLTKDSDRYRHTISEVHMRSSKRILKLCENNKGFYAKAGQFAASLMQLPREYTEILSVLQDQAVPCDFRSIKEVIRENLSSEWADMFLSFKEQPIAAGSIAQVHHAVLKSGEEVAVKVQYPGLKQLLEIDITTMSFVSEFVARLFPEYRFKWILSAFKEAISAELDSRFDSQQGSNGNNLSASYCRNFIQEARNSERTLDNFRSNKIVKVPQVFWDFTRSQVLTMEFCSGHKADDLQSLEKSGLDPKRVAKALVEVFADMIFIHGFVHGDPHPGNILVSPDAQRGFTLVILDHGIYKELDERFRRDYCHLWKALSLLDVNEIQHIGECFGVGNYARYFPLIFTGKIANSKSGFGKGMTAEERKIVKQELEALDMEDISSFMESLPPDLLTILRTDGLLRSIISKLGAPRSVRILTYAKFAVCGLSLNNASKSGCTLVIIFSRAWSVFSYLQFRCLLGVIRLLSWMDDIKSLLTRCCKRLLTTATHQNLSYATGKAAS